MTGENDWRERKRERGREEVSKARKTQEDDNCKRMTG
jgi:hypothetical protein